MAAHAVIDRQDGEERERHAAVAIGALHPFRRLVGIPHARVEGRDPQRLRAGPDRAQLELEPCAPVPAQPRRRERLLQPLELLRRDSLEPGHPQVLRDGTGLSSLPRENIAEPDPVLIAKPNARKNAGC